MFDWVNYLHGLPETAIQIIGLYILCRYVIGPILRGLRGDIADLSHYLHTVVSNDQVHIKKLLEEDREDRRALRLVVESLARQNTDTEKVVDETRRGFSGHA